ncbi:unnamed protein product, partial [Coccothraustes coccothraustes]
MGSPEQPNAPAPGACWGAEPPPQEGSVAVVLRVRPPSRRERAAPSILHVLNQHAVLFTSEEPGGTGTAPLGRRRRNIEFEFDHVFGERATQEEVFQHTTLPLLDTLLAGYNCSVFAYGASGVGKTHTMMGSKSAPGIVHLATLELYKRLEAMKDRSCEVLVSYQQPTSPEQLLGLLAKGNKNRAQRSTKANAASSRSHAIFQIQVKQWDLNWRPRRGPARGQAELHRPGGLGASLGHAEPGRGDVGGHQHQPLAAGLQKRRPCSVRSQGRAVPRAVPGQQTDPAAEGLAGRQLPQHRDRGREPRGGRRPRHLQHAALRQPGPARPAAVPAGHRGVSLQLQNSPPADLQFQTSTPSPLQQDLQDQEQNPCPDEIAAKTKESWRESTGLEEPTGLEEAALPFCLEEPSEAAPAPGMQLSCAAEAPVTMPDPSVPSTAPECCRELSPCSSPKPIFVWPVKRMPESSSDSQSENSCGSRTRMKCQRSWREAAKTPRAAQRPGQSSPVPPEPRCVSRQSSPSPSTQSPGTPAPAAARTPSPLPGPAPEQLPPSAEQQQQQPELQAAAPRPPSSTSPRAQTPEASRSSVPRSSCSSPSIPSCPPPAFWPWFQRAHVCAPLLAQSCTCVCRLWVGLGN